MEKVNGDEVSGTVDQLFSTDGIEAQLRTFEANERQRLGLVSAPENWHDPNPQRFTREQRDSTTMLFGGLTVMHDALLEAGLAGLGYTGKALPCPSNEALQFGKEFGSRGQCNPTYFTVGNLLHYLVRLRDEEGMSVQDIADKYVFVTLGSCGPCRWGTYLTEYRKVLRDAGFVGFRVISLAKGNGINVQSENSGFEPNLSVYRMVGKALFAADVINALGYRTRPYEVVPGATDEAIEECRTILREAFASGRSVMRAMRRCRKPFARVEVDRLRAKPKVSITGEFWAMTTEGDGNYHMQSFLEAEGAECEVQPITGWLLYQFWQKSYDTRGSMMLRRLAVHKHSSETNTPFRTLFFSALGRIVVQRFFYAFAHLAGLKGYQLPDMDELAKVSKTYYPSQLRGGEGHMEVGKVIQATQKRKAHMVISVKPFGCMPSSGVSDGIQALVVEKFPEANFCPIETTGDGAVSAYSRVQMALFKARTKAKEELEKALEEKGLTIEDASLRAAEKPKLRSALHYPRHEVAGTAANLAYELASAPERRSPSTAR